MGTKSMEDKKKWIRKWSTSYLLTFLLLSLHKTLVSFIYVYIYNTIHFLKEKNLSQFQQWGQLSCYNFKFPQYSQKITTRDCKANVIKRFYKNSVFDTLIIMLSSETSLLQYCLTPPQSSHLIHIRYCSSRP